MGFEVVDRQFSNALQNTHKKQDERRKTSAGRDWDRDNDNDNDLVGARKSCRPVFSFFFFFFFCHRVANAMHAGKWAGSARSAHAYDVVCRGSVCLRACFANRRRLGRAVAPFDEDGASRCLAKLVCVDILEIIVSILRHMFWISKWRAVLYFMEIQVLA